MTGLILSLALLAVTGSEPDCMIVQFTATWCEPCQQLQPALNQLQQAGYQIQQVDTDQQPQLAQQFQVESLPTLVILSQGREVDRLVGAASFETIQRRVDRVAARSSNGRPNPVPSTNAGTHTYGDTAGAPRRAPSQTGPVVRGQSATLGAFPMLASAAMSSGAMNQFASASQPPLAAPPEATSQLSSPSHSAEPAASGVQATAPRLTPEQAIARAHAATVRLRVDEANTTAFGTGTIIDMHGDEALVLTCGHLFREMTPGSQLTIDLFAGTPHEQNLPAQLIDFKAEEEDIGLVSFRVPVPIEPVELLPAAEQLSVGQPAFSFGCDHGADPTRRDTQIKSIDRYIGAANLQIFGAPAVGRSGGGLFDLQGRLIGVCNAADATDDEGIYAAAKVVYSQIERLGMSELFAGSRQAAEQAVGSIAQASLSQASLSQPSLSRDPISNNPISSNPVAAGGWPDAVRAEQALALAAAQRGSQPPTAATTNLSEPPGATARQLICIVRDASGNDRTLTIDAPPIELLESLQQHSRR